MKESRGRVCKMVQQVMAPATNSDDWDPRGRRREPTLGSYSLSSTDTLWHACTRTCTHTQHSIN